MEQPERNANLVERSRPPASAPGGVRRALALAVLAACSGSRPPTSAPAHATAIVAPPATSIDAGAAPTKAAHETVVNINVRGDVTTYTMGDGSRVERSPSGLVGRRADGSLAFAGSALVVFEDGVRQGRLDEWSADGKTCATGRVTNGRRTDVWMEWSSPQRPREPHCEPSARRSSHCSTARRGASCPATSRSTTGRTQGARRSRSSGLAVAVLHRQCVRAARGSELVRATMRRPIRACGVSGRLIDKRPRGRFRREVARDRPSSTV